MTRSPQESRKSTLPRRPGRPGKGSLLFLLLTACLLALSGGCGKKADPICPAGERPPAVADLSVSGGNGGIVLRWTVPAGAGKRGTFRIYRSALPQGEGCSGCPRTYVPFRVLDLGGLKEGEPAVIEDRDVKKQVLYSYRVVLCDDRGICGGPSNEVETFFEGKEKNL